MAVMSPLFRQGGCVRHMCGGRISNGLGVMVSRMKIRRKYRYGSVSIYLILGLTLLFIPTFLVSMIGISSSMGEIRRQREENIANQVYSQKSQIESEIRKVMDQQLRFLINEDITRSFTERYDSMDKETRGREVSRLAKSLYMVKNSNTMIVNAWLYIPSLHMEIGSEGYYRTNLSEEEEAVYDIAFQSKKSVFTYDGAIYSTAAFLPSVIRSSSSCVLVEWSTDMLPVLWAVREPGVEFILLGEDFYSTSDMDSERGTAMWEELKNTDAGERQPVIQECSYQGENYIVALVFSDLLDCTIASYQPLSIITGPIHKYQIFLWVIDFCVLCAAVGIAVFCHRMIKKPLDKLLTAFVKVQEGDLGVQIQYKGNHEFSVLIRYFNTMVRRLNRLIEENYAKEIRLKNTELRQLQVQISPHFLYNSFSVIAHSIHSGDTDSALQMTKALSEYFHYVTQNRRDMEPLSMELEFAESYLEIQSIRFGDRVDVQIEPPDEETMQIMVPRMIIQPLVENAYKHAFKELESGGKLRISCCREKGFLIISVADNGPGATEDKLEELRASFLKEEPEGHNGLFNVYQRLWLKYGRRDALQLENTEEGFLVRILIPLEG